MKSFTAVAFVLASIATVSSSYSFVAPSALQRPNTLVAPAPRNVGFRRATVSMGNNAAFGIFSPAVIAAKKILGDKQLNKLRGKGITLHSQVSILSNDLTFQYLHVSGCNTICREALATKFCFVLLSNFMYCDFALLRQSQSGACMLEHPQRPVAYLSRRPRPMETKWAFSFKIPCSEAGGLAEPVGNGV